MLKLDWTDISWRSIYRPNMKKNNLIRFVQALVFLPVLTMSFSLPGIRSIETSQNVLAQKVNIEAQQDPRVQILKVQAEAIDAYFALHDMPLVGVGLTMAEEADINNIDWRLLPAIAVRESTGGKNACDKVKNNPFGWNSCKVGFNSLDEAIETVAKNLGGNNPNTAHHYDNKTIRQILHAYNPPYIVPRYAEQVISIMNTIGDADAIPNTLTSSSAPSAQIM